jgi:FkbM family methyltransferase
MLIDSRDVVKVDFENSSRESIKVFNRTSIEKRWAFGRNVYSAALCEASLIGGFVDDYSDLTSWLGLPVIRSKDIKSDFFIIIASGGNTLSVKRFLESTETPFLDYFAFQKYSDIELPQIRFNEDFQTHFEVNENKFEKVFLQLKDSTSKTIYRKLINFRLTQNIVFLEGFKENQVHQYFDFVGLLDREIDNFIDIGAYDGENTVSFVRDYPNYSRVIMVEPNLENYNFCVSQTKKYRGISHIQAVLGDSERVVEFEGDGTTGFVVQAPSTSEGTKVQMKTLDSICGDLEGITLIKMDVEGGEEQVLSGGRTTLKRIRPILAISGYHRVQDFWRIPEIVFETLTEYSVFVRHYTETIYETVFFFIPNEIGLTSSESHQF